MASAGQKWLQMPQRLQRVREKTGTCFVVVSFVVATALLYISSPAFGVGWNEAAQTVEHDRR